MKKLCELCNGSGQTGSFKGTSRFLITWEECPECGGLGYVWEQNSDMVSDRQNAIDSAVDNNNKEK